MSLWSWDIEVDNCAICRNLVMEFCIECQANRGGSIGSSGSGHNDECTVAWGVCNHAFHFHCISRWLRTRPSCPLDNQDWSATQREDAVAAPFARDRCVRCCRLLLTRLLLRVHVPVSQGISKVWLEHCWPVTSSHTAFRLSSLSAPHCSYVRSMAARPRLSHTQKAYSSFNSDDDDGGDEKSEAGRRHRKAAISTLVGSRRGYTRTMGSARSTDST